MPGPIIRSGPSPDYSSNWDRAFAKKKTAKKKTSTSTAGKKTAKKKKKS